MKAVMLMFDTLTRNFLPEYGCDWTRLPNFQRLAKHSLTFDHFYASSLPCMPARRDLHTGCYSFLLRDWGPLEPFDFSCIEALKNAGVYTHLVSDHAHYWEDGGATYHTRYNTWQFARGQEGDPWIGQVSDPAPSGSNFPHKTGKLWRQDRINRQFLLKEEDMPQTKAVRMGLDFLERNAKEDRWFLQLELFDPHEPFFVPESYRSLYQDLTESFKEQETPQWPVYGKNSYTKEQTKKLRLQYAALLSMCDASLGKILDFFDEHALWEDTMLIVNTDHGFLLGERDFMGKNVMPCYEEIAHLPFFLWDPRYQKKDQRRSALAQTIDIPPTLLDYFQVKVPANQAPMDGHSLSCVICDDSPIRAAGLFGIHGGHINVTDGNYVLMRAPISMDNQPLYSYTLMPTHMDCRFSVEELSQARLAEHIGRIPCPVLQIPASSYIDAYRFGDLLFDTVKDPKQLTPLSDTKETCRLLNLMCQLLSSACAPIEQFQRMGLPAKGLVTPQWLSEEGARRQPMLPPQLSALPMTEDARSALTILYFMVPSTIQPTIISGIRALVQKNLLTKVKYF